MAYDTTSVPSRSPKELELPPEGPMDYCDGGPLGFYWTKGHIRRSKMRGKALGDKELYDQDVEAKDIFAAPLRQGWMSVEVGQDENGCMPGEPVYRFHHMEVPDSIPVTWLDLG